MALKVEFAPQAKAAFELLDGLLKQKAADCLVELQGNPRPEGSVRVEGETGVYRLRAGDFRILYEVASKVLRVMDLRTVGHKGSAR
jgi:mRNA interferase RelE/StbE